MTVSTLVQWMGNGWLRINQKRDAVVRWGGAVGLCLALFLLWPQAALATTWYPVASASQGQQQQFVDIDSIEPLGLGQVRVASFYIDSRSGEPQKTTYLTDYDCRRRWFRDVQYNGPTGSSAWLPVDPDPLNAAAMEYVCGLVRQ